MPSTTGSAPETISAISLERGDSFIGPRHRLCVVTGDPFTRCGYRVVHYRDVEGGHWGAMEAQPLAGFQRLARLAEAV